MPATAAAVPIHHDDPDKQTAETHCVQCGEGLDPERQKVLPSRERNYCIDCAFHDMPCTD